MKVSKILLLLSLTGFAFGIILLGNAPDFITTCATQWSVFAKDQPLTFSIGFTCAFVLLLTLGLPGGAVMCVLGGFFFGAAAGACICLFSTLVSTVLIHSLVQRADIAFAPRLLPRLRKKAATLLNTHRHYVPLLIRMIPVLPFYLVSLLFSHSGLSVRTNLIATAIGGAPSAIAFSLIGSNLQTAITSDTTSLSRLILNPWFWAPVAFLTTMSICALILRNRWAH